LGDLSAPVLTLKQRLPDLKNMAPVEEGEDISIAAQAEEPEAPRNRREKNWEKSQSKNPAPARVAGKKKRKV
jgi:hypothetical protein